MKCFEKLFHQLRDKLKIFNLKFLSYIKNNKNFVLIVLIICGILSIGIYISYAYFSDIISRNLFTGSVESFSSPHLNIKYMVEDRDESGVGIGTYTAYWNAPEKDYIYIPEMSFCTNGATFLRNSDDTFDVSSPGKTRCEFYYDAADLTTDADIKITVLKEKDESCKSGTCEYEVVPDYTIAALLNSEFKFIIEKSTCTGGSSITFDEINKQLVTSAIGKTECRAYFDNVDPFSEYILENYDESAGLIQHTSDITTSAGDNNYRFSGNNPNNWVCFGSDASSCPKENLFRVVGIYDGYVKLIKAHPVDKNKDGIYNVSYNPYETQYNHTDHFLYDSGHSNKWEGTNTSITTDDADVNIYLNTTYYNSFNENYRSMIEPMHYNIGLITEKSTNVAKSFYNYEIATVSKQKYNVALMNISDYFYASNQIYWGYYNDSGTISNSFSQNTTVYKSSWLYMNNVGDYGNSGDCTINADTSNSAAIFTPGLYGAVNKGYVGYPSYDSAYRGFAVRPVFYLDYYVNYQDGSGTVSDPFRLEL